MGLDMYLQVDKYVSGWDFRKDESFDTIASALGVEDLITADSPSMTVSVTVAYWRKANAIHNWFVRECADGKDECQRIYVEPKKLEELRELVKQVTTQPDRAGQLLPTGAGFFFGSTDYDDYYLLELERTLEILDKVIPLTEKFDIHYQASW